MQQHHVSYNPEQTMPLCQDCHHRVHHEDGYHDDLVPDERRHEDFETDLQNYRVQARLEPSLAAAVEEYRSERGLNKSDVLRDALRAFLGDEGEPAGGPSDPQLHEAWSILKRHADDRGIVHSEDILPKLASKMNVEKRAVIRSRIRPLDRNGWLDARSGKLRIYDRPRDGDDRREQDRGVPDSLFAVDEGEGVDAKRERIEERYGNTGVGENAE